MRNRAVCGFGGDVRQTLPIIGIRVRTSTQYQSRTVYVFEIGHYTVLYSCSRDSRKDYNSVVCLNY